MPAGNNKAVLKMTEVEDQISALLDHIISHILTLLTLKEAMATSILSKRWLNLWTSHPFLDFKCFFPKPMKYLAPETFISRVHKILEKFNGSKIHTFRIFLPDVIPVCFSCHLDHWISFAFTNRVSKLELTLISYNESIKRYNLPIHVFCDEFMKPKHWNLTSILSNSPKKHFEFLKDLSLSFINLSDDVYDIMLFHCSSFERIYLMRCSGLKFTKNSAPQIMLKSMVLIHCYDLKKLQLLAPNLVSFVYDGSERTLLVKDAQRLASLCLKTRCYVEVPNSILVFPRRKSFVINHFSSYLRKLQSFVVSVHLFKDTRDFAELGVFDNLKHLLLDVRSQHLIRLGYQVVASIIRGSPYLELLELSLPSMFYYTGDYEFQEMFSMPPHQNLKLVKLYGYKGDKFTNKFLPYLVESAVSLQKIVITANGAVVYGGELHQCPVYWKNQDEAKYCKNCVLQLRQTLPANTHLVFCDAT